VGCNWKAYITRDQLWAKSLSIGLHLSQGGVPTGLFEPARCLLDVCSTFARWLLRIGYALCMRHICSMFARLCKHPIK